MLVHNFMFMTAATIGIADYTNYEDMKHAVCFKVFSSSSL
jgi:hypothetical protein